MKYYSGMFLQKFAKTVVSRAIKEICEQTEQVQLDLSMNFGTHVGDGNVYFEHDGCSYRL